jgi:hypothetical protein
MNQNNLTSLTDDSKKAGTARMRVMWEKTVKVMIKKKSSAVGPS